MRDALAAVLLIAAPALAQGEEPRFDPSILITDEYAPTERLALLLDDTEPDLMDSMDSGESPADTPAATTNSAGDLAKKAQNPIANMISIPIQNNTNFNGGPNGDKHANVLNIQPVVPFSLGEDWNVITRTIIPLIYLPEVVTGLPELPSEGDMASTSSVFGLGDINFSAFFSPASESGFTWGVGPSLTVPSATDSRIGSEKWSAGPTVVALYSNGPWVVGGLVRHLWSFAGDSDRSSVNQTLIQPFVNYNLDDGWYLVTAPILTANWNSDSADRWLVPLGGGVGKLIRIGKQPVNVNLQAYYNVERPDFGPEWSIRFQFTLLFPK